MWNRGPGEDTVVGDGGHDTVAGGEDYDVILGGTGDDVMISGDDSHFLDDVVGGPDFDVCLFEAGDEVKDCEYQAQHLKPSSRKGPSFRGRSLRHFTKHSFQAENSASIDAFGPPP